MDCIPGTDTDCGVHFDKRPGDLEATRGISVAKLHRAKASSAAGDACSIVASGLICSHKRHDGWRVLIQMNAEVTSADARRIAAEINRYADLIDERVDW